MNVRPIFNHEVTIMSKALRAVGLSLLLTIYVGLNAAASCEQHYRDKRMPPRLVMDAIGLKPGMVIGEAGAGDGYFTFKMIERIGEQGAIYANDILKSALNRMNRRRDREGIENIHTVLGEVADPMFPRNDLEMVVMVHSFHDFEKPVLWLKNLKKYLKPDASVVIIDGDPAKTGGTHTLPKEKIIAHAEAAGYRLQKDADILPHNLILIFTGSDQDNYNYYNN
jgi:ubiquinone/menaquinone biosynthesis C-methylase UbiE